MLIEQIKLDRMTAMKEGDALKKNLLSTLVGEASKEDKVPTDEKVIATIRKFIKGAEETLKILHDKGISALSAGSSNQAQEIVILEAYLPKQLTETQIRDMIESMIKIGTKDLKTIMSVFKGTCSGQYDGGLVSKIAKEML